LLLTLFPPYLSAFGKPGGLSAPPFFCFFHQPFERQSPLFRNIRAFRSVPFRPSFSLRLFLCFSTGGFWFFFAGRVPPPPPLPLPQVGNSRFLGVSDRDFLLFQAPAGYQICSFSACGFLFPTSGTFLLFLFFFGFFRCASCARPPPPF